MKKFFLSIMAFAAMAMTLTSCNKEEAATAGDFSGVIENNDVMKTHFEGIYIRWDNNDRFIIMDGASYPNIARYYMTTTDGINVEHHFMTNIRGTFNEDNGTLTAFYPESIVYNYSTKYAMLPTFQRSDTGECNGFPMYSQAPKNSFMWRNLCGKLSLQLTGDVTLDSVAITTDKYLNGNFLINMSNLDKPLTAKYLGYEGLAHATKTNTLRFNQPLQLTSTSKDVEIYLPANIYNSFDITFYANNGTKRVIRFRNPINIARTHFNQQALQLNGADFVADIKGAINGQYNIGTTSAPQYVIFSQGNLEYVARAAQYWRFADNQWGFRTRAQGSGDLSFDRDLFGWGANGYLKNGHFASGYGNNITVWPNNKEYAYYTGTTLSGTNEWGNNKIANAGYSFNSGWRTLTAEEMQNILNNHNKAIVTLGFVGKTGLLLFPADYAGTTYNDGDVITKQQYTALQNAGCVFFSVENYRMPTGTIGSRIPSTGTTSYFWLNTTSETDATVASALVVTANGYSIVNDVNRNTGAFVRLVKDVQ